MSEILIECEELVKIYESDGVKCMALQGLDLKIRKGEFLAILGKSGSGKSTLLNMIGGLETPTAGRLFFEGRDLSGLEEAQMVHYRKQTVGFVWQKSARNLLPYMTVLENVELPMCFEPGKEAERRKRAEDLLKKVGLFKHASKYPLQLSGGEQQRVAIAVALANEPRLLLADEPTGAVDSRTAEQILKLFKSLNRELGLTILLVTHDLRLADRVNRVIRISDGKISREKLRIRDESKAEKVQSAGEDRETLEKTAEAGWQKVAFPAEPPQVEYGVLDRAHRLQLDEEMLKQAGIDTNKVCITAEEGRIVLTPQKKTLTSDSKM